jgi:hypothetical protein
MFAPGGGPVDDPWFAATAPGEGRQGEFPSAQKKGAGRKGGKAAAKKS